MSAIMAYLMFSYNSSYLLDKFVSVQLPHKLFLYPADICF